MNIAQFATELRLPITLLLEQFRAAGITKQQETDLVGESDKAQLLDYLRRLHGVGDMKSKIVQLKVATRSADTRTTVADAGAPLEVVALVKHKRQLKVDNYFSKVEKLLAEHPNESLNNMRKTVEAICKDILDETYENKDVGKVLKPASAFISLEEMIQELKRRKPFPVAIEKYLAVLQQFGNFGSHDQESDNDDVLSEISASIMANSSLLPLKALVHWYKTF